MVDMVVHRHDLRATIARLCRLLTESAGRARRSRASACRRRRDHAAFQREPRRRSTPMILARLLALHPKRIDLSLDRIERLLAALGHPERRLPPVIHVAGTNGKGRPIAFMRAILEAAEQRVHVYTSPNLVRLNERFRIGQPGGGKSGRRRRTRRLRWPNARRRTATRRSRCSRWRRRRRFCCSRAIRPTFVLLEVGLGGRLDATNVVERPLASVITRLSLDHRDFLGDTLVAIAAEKAGILKPGVPAVVTEPDARCACGDRAAGGAGQGAARHRRRGLDRDRGARPAGLSGRRRAARSAGAEALRPPSVRECRRGDRGVARERA